MTVDFTKLEINTKGGNLKKPNDIVVSYADNTVVEYKHGGLPEIKKRERLDAAIINKLRDAGKEGVLGPELVKITHRFGATIERLRKDGWLIETLPVGHSIYKYTLLGFQK